MGRRVNWSRAKPLRRPELEPTYVRALEAKADALLNLPHLTVPGEDERLTPERGYFRSI